VGKIGIYRKGNDIKLGVIPRYEESPEVLFMIKFIIFWSSRDAPKGSGQAFLRQHDGQAIMSLVGTRELQEYNKSVEFLEKHLTFLVKIFHLFRPTLCWLIFYFRLIR